MSNLIDFCQVKVLWLVERVTEHKMQESKTKGVRVVIEQQICFFFVDHRIQYGKSQYYIQGKWAVAIGFDTKFSARN